MLAHQVPVARADRERGRDRQVRYAEPLKRPPHQLLAGLGRADPLRHEHVEDRPAGVEPLQLLLMLQRLEGVLGPAHRKLAGVRVVGRALRPGLDDLRPALLILPRESVRRTLSGCGLQVVEMPRLLLDRHQSLPDVVQQVNRELSPPLIRDVMLAVREVGDALVDAVHADRAEVIAQAPEVALCVGKQAVIYTSLHCLALEFKALRGDLKQGVQPLIERRQIALREVPRAGTVQRDNADRACLLR